MAIHIIYALLLLGHVIGDFYMQSKPMAENKENDYRYLLLHSCIYTFCMAVTLVVGISLSSSLVWLWLSVSLTHFCIDAMKKYITTKPFIIDQLLHLLFIGFAWQIWGRGLHVRDFILWEAVCFPTKPIVIIVLGFLLVIRPVGILIGKGEIWDFSKAKNKPSESQKGAGKMIGYLERIIVFILLLNGQYGAIAFVIAAKSVARFPEISSKEGNSLAEYYLIGTLLSMASVFTVVILLGLAKY